jgi:transcription elongation factor Elf1
MSDSDRITINFTCNDCGGTVLTLPDDHTDDSIASCKSCGVEFGRWGDIQAKAMETAKGEVTDMMRESLKGIKGFKVK